MKNILKFSLIIFATFVLFFAFRSTEAQDTTPACKVTDAYFAPSGDQPSDWFQDLSKKEIKIVIKGQNCEGKKLYLSIVEEDTCPRCEPTFDDDIKGFDNRPFYIPPSNILEISLKPGEDECEWNIGVANDCKWYLNLHKTDGGLSEKYSTKMEPTKRISFECDGWCDEEAEFINTNFGATKTEWFFFGKVESIGATKTESNMQGPFTTIAACKTSRDTWIEQGGLTEKGVGKCFFKVTFVPTVEPNMVTGSSSYNQDYELLAPIPGLVPGNVVGKDFKLGDYINNLLKVVLGLAAALAVIMIIFGGVQWMMADSFLGKGAGKENIKNAIYGLLLALGSYLILVTINPNLVNINFGLDKQTLTIQEVGDDGVSVVEVSYTNETGTCPKDCTNLLPEVPIKNSSGKQVEKEIKKGLTKLSQSLYSDPLIKGRWGTTEAWSPSRVHKAQCHQKGTCIDANFLDSNPTPAMVKSFIDKATASGLCAIYEVKTEQHRNSVLQGGVSASKVKNLGSWISAPHFSVYGGNCK